MVDFRSLSFVCLFAFLSCAIRPPESKPPQPSDQNVQKSSPMHMCFQIIATGKLEDFEKNKSECVNYKNDYGLTSFMFSIYKNRKDVFDFLLAQPEVDVNTADQGGDTALFYAVVGQRLEMIEALRAKGAKIKFNSIGVSPLWIALQNSRAELIFALAPNKHEVNLRADDGFTALHFAIRRKQVSVFNFILESGAETKFKDAEGKTPLEFARDEVKWDYAVIWLGRE